MTGFLDETDDLAARHDFLAQYAEDQAAGRIVDLATYQARFPGFEDAIAAEYAWITAPVEAATDPAARRRVGPYRLIRELGRGGQATVFLARDERLGRDVALKLLPRDLASVEQELRLRREAQTAARWHDPCICEVFDVGDDGSHLFVTMRYVEGETLAARIARTRERDGPGRVVALTDTAASADLEAVLVVFERLAHSLHRAHRDGVIHRDVKPANVMITPTGEPVLLDFGLAFDASSGMPTLTRSGDRFGTPAYMAPEQIAGTTRETDARCDVYALGVSLFEAVTLTRPFEAPTLDALYREILTREPDDVRRRNPALPRDLAVVIATALAKERERRYQSALDLAADLARVRCQDSILARPPGPLLRAWRWRRRHPAWAAALAIVVIGVAALVVQQTRSLRAIGQARDEAEAVNDFLIGELLLAVTPDQARGVKLTVEEVLDRAARRVDDAFADRSPAGAAVRHVLGAAYRSTSRYADAERWLTAALAAREHLFGAEDPRTLATRLELARVRSARDDHQAARELATEVLRRRTETLGSDHPDTLDASAMLIEADLAEGRVDAALARAEADQELALARLGADHPRTLMTREWVARALVWLDRRGEAEPILRDVLARRRAATEADDPKLQSTMMALGSLLHDVALRVKTAAAWDAAEDLYREALAHAEQVFGMAHIARSVALNNYGLLLKDRATAEQNTAVMDRAATFLAASLALRRELFGTEHSQVATALDSLGGLYYERGDYARAEPLMAEGYAMRQRLLGSEHVGTLYSLLNLGTCILRAGDSPRALPLFDELVERAAVHPGVARHDLTTMRYYRGRCLEGVGRRREAIEELERSWQLAAEQHGEQHVACTGIAEQIVRVCTELGDTEAAQRWQARVGD